jgi:hypothetical protein
VLPAHQRLDAADPPAGQRDDRLVQQLELVGVERAVQLRADLRLLQQIGVHRRGVVGVPALAVLLRGVQRDVGVAQQPFRVVARLGFRHPDARLHHQAVAARGERVGEAGQQPLGHLDRGLRRRTGEEHGELVAAEAGHRVTRPYARGEPLGHGDQQPVADGVPERVIYDLKIVQVDEEHRRPGAPAQGGLEPVAEEHPVGQLRQRVVGRLMVQPVLVLAQRTH